MTTDHSSPWGRLFFGIFLVVAGLTVAIASWGPALAKTRAARQWPAREAEVLVSEKGATGVDQRYSEPLLVYGYRVGDREYLSSRFTYFAMRGFTEDGTRSYLERFPRGKKAACFVNPADPREAVLDPFWLPLDPTTASVAFCSALAMGMGLRTILGCFF